MDGGERCQKQAGAPVCGEVELVGWRGWCQAHAERFPARDFERELAPAFRFGLEARRDWRDAFWNSELEREMEQEWAQRRCGSRLSWAQARELVRQGFEGFRGERRQRVVLPARITPVPRAPTTLWTRLWHRFCGMPA